ncbi:MAG: FGGY-family carbohydrate kinase [Clostridia bacterium]|nr:FGGY-family carbohydrate kinase [Clostridia bacterium]
MSDPIVLTFDVGTQSVRCLLVTPDGAFLDKEQMTYETPYFSREPGWAEQRPDFYFEQMAEISRRLLARNGALTDRIKAVSVTCIRDTVLCLDKNREPLRDIILWLDSRKAKFDRPFGAGKKMLFDLIGMGDSIKKIYKATAANWLMQNEPENWEQTDKYVMLPTYLNYLLTGELKDAAANMIGHVPFDYKNRRWMGEKDLTRCVSDVPAEKLCELVPSGEVIGHITEKASERTGIPAGLPLVACGSDKGCETLGLSVVRDDRASVSLGTTATLQMATKDYFEPQPFLPAYPAVPNDLYNPEFEVYRGFWLVSWFIKEFAAEERADAQKRGVSPEQVLDESLKRVPPGCEGLLLQPFWTAGIANPNALGSMVGFADFHTRAHFYRAIIEGIGFELYNGLTTMQKRSGKTVKELYVAGGGSRSDAVCQIMADLFGIPVMRTQTSEACSVGASIPAFIRLGVFKSYEDAIARMVHIKDTFTPDAENHAVYASLYEQVYSKIYPGLKTAEKNIMTIYKRR